MLAKDLKICASYGLLVDATGTGSRRPPPKDSTFGIVGWDESLRAPTLDLRQWLKHLQMSAKSILSFSANQDFYYHPMSFLRIFATVVLLFKHFQVDVGGDVEPCYASLRWSSIMAVVV